MPDIHKVSVALTGEQIAALKAAVNAGEYATTSEIVREAIRDWQNKRLQFTPAQIERLRELYIQGKSSGPAKPLDLGKLRQQARKRLAATKKAPRNGH